jgi:hypothetical protein
MVPAILMVALFMGWLRVVTWFLLPFFVLMIMFSYVMTGVFALATECNADFCAGGGDETPEGTLDQIMMQFNKTKGSFYYDMATFYASQCQTEGPWGFLEGYYGDLVSCKNVSSRALSSSIVRTQCSCSLSTFSFTCSSWRRIPWTHSLPLSSKPRPKSYPKNVESTTVRPFNC